MRIELGESYIKLREVLSNTLNIDKSQLFQHREEIIFFKFVRDACGELEKK